MFSTNCAAALEPLKEGTPNMSVYAFQVRRIRELFRERDRKCLKIDPTTNSASQDLAQVSRVQALTQDRPYNKLCTFRL
jgi:hypothetical protein